MHKPFDSHFNHYTLCLPIVLIVSCLIYFQGLFGPFLLDDLTNIAPTVPEQLTFSKILQILESNPGGPTGRPVSQVSFMLNGYFFGLSALAFKSVNLLLHGINGFLIFHLSRSLLSFNHNLTRQQINFTACFTASLWLLHPIQTSTVLYAVQRMTELASLFSLLSLILFSRFRVHLYKQGGFAFKPLILSILFSILAVLSKENGALLVFYIALIELFFFRLQTSQPTQKTWLLTLLFFFSILPILLILLYLSQFITADFPHRNFNVYERLLTQINVLAFYLKNIFLPNVNHMGLMLDGFSITRTLDIITLVNALLLLTLGFSSCYCFRKYPPIGFGIAFYFFGHLFESTVIPLEIAFEHRNYLPLFGLCFAFAALIQYLSAQIHHYYLVATITIIISVLTVNTFLRSQQWSDEQIFFETELANHPNSLRANVGMANVFLKQQDTTKARSYLHNAARLDQSDAAAVLHQLITYCHQQNAGETTLQLLEQGNNRLQYGLISPYSLENLNRLQILMMSGKCPALSAKQLVLLTQAIQNNKRYADPGGKYSLLHARSLNLSGNLTVAAAFYQKAYKKANRQIHPQILNELGIVYIKLNQLAEASAILETLKQIHHPPFLDSSWQIRRIAQKLAEAKISQQGTGIK